jgi:hypothetical protein
VTFSVQVAPDVELHPVHELNVLPFPEVAGAVSVTVVLGT